MLPQQLKQKRGHHRNSPVDPEVIVAIVLVFVIVAIVPM